MNKPIRHLQALAGDYLFEKAPDYRHYLLARWFTEGTTLPRWEKWLFDGLSDSTDRRYYGAKSTEERDRIKALCMGGSFAVAWARHQLAQEFPDASTPASRFFAEIESLLTGGDIETVHQAACSSGREVAYFARRFPEVTFIGSDGDETLVDFLREKWRDLPNLSFDLVCLAEQELPGEGSLTCDLLYACSSMAYQDPEILRGFFQSTLLTARHILLSEPVSITFPMETATASSPQGRLKWDHPYRSYLQESGWKNIRVQEELPGSLAPIRSVTFFAESPHA